jgi:hypothetical protein
MFKSIMKAIVGALRGAFRMLRGLAALPGQALRGLLGFAPDCDELRPAPAFDLDDEEAGPELNRSEYYGLAAARVLSWCGDRLTHDKPPPLPPGLPLEISWWLPGLSRQECKLLIAQDYSSTSSHLQGICEIAGVRPVQPLLPESWPAGPREEPAEAVVVTRRGRSEPAAPSRP